MRIIRLSALPAVIRVKGPGISAVAIPDDLPSHEVLELASLVLSTREYEEVRRAISPPPLVPSHYQGRWLEGELDTEPRRGFAARVRHQ